jgi:hypothetical protein
MEQNEFFQKISKCARNEYGLMSSVEYILNDDNTINWRSMLKKEHLVPNRDAFKDKSNLKNIDVSTLPDNQLLILLAGIKELAQIRGFNNVKYKVIQASPEYVAVKCTINWIPNFETNNQPVSFSALADAHLDNTKDFAKNFLMAIAENRAFIRCVRNFLKINIVGNDEIGKTTSSVEALITENEHPNMDIAQPIALLKQTMEKYGISFDQIKERAVQKNMDGAINWSSIEDMTPLAMFTVISGIKKRAKSKSQVEEK